MKSFLDFHPAISVLHRPHSKARQTRAPSSQQVWERENQSENALHWVPLCFRKTTIWSFFLLCTHFIFNHQTINILQQDLKSIKNNSFKKRSPVDFLLRKVRIRGRLNSKDIWHLGPFRFLLEPRHLDEHRPATKLKTAILNWDYSGFRHLHRRLIPSG